MEERSHSSDTRRWLCSLLSLQGCFSVKGEADCPGGTLGGVRRRCWLSWPRGVLLAFTRWRPGVLLNRLQHMRQSPRLPPRIDNKERCCSQSQAGSAAPSTLVSVRLAALPRVPWSPARAAAHQALLIRSSGSFIRSPSAVQTGAAQPRWPDSAASKSPVLTRAAVSTVAVHSHPTKAKAVYMLTPAVAEGKATRSGTCGQTHSLYSQGFFQEPCCVKTTPPPRHCPHTHTEGPL